MLFRSGTGVGINEGVVGEDGQELRKVWEDKEGAEGYLAVAVPKVRFVAFPAFACSLTPFAVPKLLYRPRSECYLDELGLHSREPGPLLSPSS